MYIALMSALSIVGIALSIYMLFVEYRLKSNPAYKPVCDISDRISCIKPMQSEYGKLFGISNAWYGVLFYATLFWLLYTGYSFDAVRALVIIGALYSVYLSYHLYVTMRLLCVVCTALYGVNFLLLALVLAQ